MIFRKRKLSRLRFSAISPSPGRPLTLVPSHTLDTACTLDCDTARPAVYAAQRSTHPESWACSEIFSGAPRTALQQRKSFPEVLRLVVACPREPGMRAPLRTFQPSDGRCAMVPRRLRGGSVTTRAKRPRGEKWLAEVPPETATGCRFSHCWRPSGSRELAPHCEDPLADAGGRCGRNSC